MGAENYKMKFLTGRQLLHHAAYMPLTEIRSEDVETAINVEHYLFLSVLRGGGGVRGESLNDGGRGLLLCS